MLTDFSEKASVRCVVRGGHLKMFARTRGVRRFIGTMRVLCSGPRRYIRVKGQNHYCVLRRLAQRIKAHGCVNIVRSVIKRWICDFRCVRVDYQWYVLTRPGFPVG